MGQPDHQIAFIVDLDGFILCPSTRTSGKSPIFLCREAAIINCRTLTVELYYFRLDRSYDSLSPADRQRVRHARNYCHGLEFSDDPTNPRELPQHYLLELIKHYAEKAARQNQLIAYKGGHVELDIFRQLTVTNYFNLEDLQCPPFNVLYATPQKWLWGDDCLHDIASCSLHTRVQHRKPVHCAAVEVYYFALWLRSHWPQLVEQF